ncbi:MAG: hypothetical protein M3N51_11030 [Actinomycetota bacterium]|nr:hypothetical protein [Actinomycetota bacterium]
MPEWLVAALQPPPPPRRRHLAAVGDVDPYALAALQGEVGVVIAAPERQRNDTLNAASFASGTLVGSGALDESTVADQLLHAARVAGLPQAEAARTIRSGLQAGRRQPREVAR